MILVKYSNILIVGDSAIEYSLAHKLSLLNEVKAVFVAPGNDAMKEFCTIVDIREDTLNLDENLIEAAITSKTKAICVVHYAGVACEMDTIMAIAERYGLAVVEDAAQGVMSSYKGRVLGSIGDLGAYSFHETKNVAF